MNNINTAIYVRVSTEEQALHGFSIRAQKEKLTYYAEKIKEWNVYDIYVDEGLSGKNIIDRPELNRMILNIKQKKVNNVLVFKIDRLTRSTKDLIELVEVFNKYNCDFNSLCESIDTTTPTGRMFIKIIGIFSEFERENIIERVKLGFERKAKEGYSICSSTPPYGYYRNKGSNVLSVYKREALVVKKIFRMFLNGKSVTNIVNYLILNTIKTKKNKKWSYKTVKLILSNPTYIGKIRYGINKKNYFESDGFHEPIIKKQDFVKVQKILLNHIKSKDRYDAYFSHVLKCKCGNAMVPKRIYKIDKNGNRKIYINYRCKDKKLGCNKDISHFKLEKMMINLYPCWQKFDLEKKNSVLFENNIELTIENNRLISNIDLII